MKRALPFALWACLLPAAVEAQRVRGVVVEDSTGRPISEAKIELIGTDTTVQRSALSSATGWFDIPVTSAGEYLVIGSHPAYRNLASLIANVDSLNVTVVLRLSGGPIPLEPLLVRAQAYDNLSGFRDRSRQRAFGHYITRADIDKRGAFSISHLLRLTPEVRVETVRSGIWSSQGVFMRSFGDLCMPSVYVDGVPVPPGEIVDVDQLLTVEQVAGIEVYRNAMSAPMELRLPAFGADMSCGVIALWSRPVPGEPLTLKRVLFAGGLIGGSMFLLSLIK